MKLTPEQEKVLLHKHLTGDFPGQRWETINALFDKKMICENGKRIGLTVAGRAYCDENHMRIKL